MVDRRGVPQFYLRDRDPNGNDLWVVCDDNAPFQREMSKRPFSFSREVTTFNEETKEEETTVQVVGTTLKN